MTTTQRPAPTLFVSKDGAVTVLDLPCGPCEGTGFVYNPAWQRYWDEYTQRFGNLTPERAAPDADEWGDEHEPREPEDITCVRCRGTGLIPTVAGKAILAFVQRHTGAVRS